DCVLCRASANGSPQDAPGQHDVNEGFLIDNLTTAVYNHTNGTGNDDANVINGNSGDNTLNALGGADTIHGNDGNDTIDGGAGSDLIDGGAGVDTATGYSANVALAFDGTNWTVTDGGDVDTLVGIERVEINGHAVLLVGPNGPFTIQAAVNAASSGDTIHIAAGTYTEQVVINGKDLTLIADDG